jgi:hypothetical protein
MIRQIYISKGQQAWLLPIYAWLGICAAEANGEEYEFPEEDETDARVGVPGDILAIQIDNWVKADFVAFLYAYQLGEIRPPKETRIVADGVRK